jgi:hypothetical protein
VAEGEGVKKALLAAGAELDDRAGRARIGEASARVRPLTERDLPQVVELYEAIFTGRGNGSPEARRSYLHEILCRNPWRDDALPSLVCEDESGRIAGCLGVMPRRMTLAGRPILTAISHTFMVAPGRRASLAGLELAKAFLSGPQDLTVAEGGDASRRILGRFGGSTSLLYSLRWTRPLRPTRYVLSVLRRRGLPAVLSWALHPLTRAADAIGPALLPSSARLARPRVTGEPLDGGTLLECLSEFTSDRALRPVYDRDSLRWLVDLLARHDARGALQSVAVRDPAGPIVGWYMYYLKPGGISEVVQIGARRTFLSDVLDHLFHHAWHGGAAAVSGQMDPAAFQALSAKVCIFHHDGRSWFLLHSRHPEVLHAIHRGDAFLSRLEGEWCISL